MVNKKNGLISFIVSVSTAAALLSTASPVFADAVDSGPADAALISEIDSGPADPALVSDIDSDETDISDKETAETSGLFETSDYFEAEEEDDVSEFDQEAVNVLDFGAVPDDGRDDSGAINNALKQAWVTKKHITVIVPKGNYDISRTLYILSNTDLILDPEAVFTSHITAGGTMLSACYLDENGQNCTDQRTGYSNAENISVEGGTWLSAYEPETDRAIASVSIMEIRHSKNITIKNMVCKYSSEHFIILSGSQNAVVSNISFQDAKESDKDTIYHVEAVHLDYCNEEGEPTGRPWDDTPAKDIVVENCTFTNVFSGVGNHHAIPKNGEVTSNITIRNCSFDGITSYAVRENGINGLTVDQCTVRNAPVFVSVTNGNDVNIYNSDYDGENKSYQYLEDKEGAVIPPVFLTDNTNVSVVNNSIAGSKYGDSTLTVSRCKNTVLEDNSISGISNAYALSVNYGKKAVIKNNTISDCDGNGIHIYGNSNADFSGDQDVENQVVGNQIVCAGDALYIYGKTEKDPCVVSIVNNRLETTSPDSYDMFLSKYVVGTDVDRNVFANNQVYASPTVTWSGNQELPKIKEIIFDKKSYTYNGEKIIPKITVKDSNGRVLTEVTDYKTNYLRNNKAGTATLTVTGRGFLYNNQVITKDFTINPIKVKSPKIVLDQTDYIYDGASKFPAVSAVYVNNEPLPASEYRASYVNYGPDVGTYKVEVTLKNNYSGSGTASYKIRPKSTTIRSLTAGSRKITVKWKKSELQTTGYEILCSLTKNFKKVAAKKTIKNYKTVSGTLTDLTPNKTYYVRIRVYKTVDGKKYYSDWKVFKTTAKVKK